MIIKYLPVLPPKFRPMVQLKDKSNVLIKTDLNQIYGKIIDINNKIGRLKKFNVTKKIIENENLSLQKIIDKLIVEKIASKDLTKSLSRRLETKSGLFRKNLLGKTVNYSARSVITVEPKLKLNQCGLPEIINKILR